MGHACGGSRALQKGLGLYFVCLEELGVWLIEVNSSPDLSYSTLTTKELVKQMIEET